MSDKVVTMEQLLESARQSEALAIQVAQAAQTGIAGKQDKLPAGGIAGQALVKASDTDGDVKWASPGGLTYLGAIFMYLDAPSGGTHKVIDPGIPSRVYVYKDGQHGIVIFYGWTAKYTYGPMSTNTGKLNRDVYLTDFINTVQEGELLINTGTFYSSDGPVLASPCLDLSTGAFYIRTGVESMSETQVMIRGFARFESDQIVFKE